MADLRTRSPHFQDFHYSAQRLSAIVMACFDPVFEPEIFKYQISTPPTFQIYCSKWGDLGQLVCADFPSQSQIRFESPQPISTNELPKYEKLIREECIGPRGRLAELYGQQEIVNQTLSQTLYEKRMQLQQEFKIWLFGRLQIFGVHDLYQGPISNNSNKIDEHFDFPIKGTPAQFSVMLHQFAQTLHPQTEFQKLVCQVLHPGSQKNSESIPPDANPVKATLSLGKSTLSIHAQILPSNGTLLRIHLNGDKNLWRLWDRTRDELEKLGWFSLPEIPEEPVHNETKLAVQDKLPPSEIWMSIPDIGANREILRLWHQGLTCEQIAVRVGLTGKTVLNRINKLRNEFGIQIVPYRKSNFIEKAKARSS